MIKAKTKKLFNFSNLSSILIVKRINNKSNGSKNLKVNPDPKANSFNLLLHKNQNKNYHFYKKNKIFLILVAFKNHHSIRKEINFILHLKMPTLIKT
jgi:hypothetical protein